MSDYEQQQGALERLGIPVETIPPDSVLTSGQARSIRFRVSRPQGYAYGDVESFIFEYLLPTLEWYANALHQRDLAVHKLGELADILEVNNLNLQAQLDNKEYNEALGVAIEEDENSSDIDILVARIKELEAQLASGGGPENGEYYSREEVEQYIASAEAEAAASATANAETAYKQQLATAVAQAVAAKEAELVQQMQQPEGYYTAEQVQAILQENAGYSAEQVQAIVEEARAEIINSGQYFTQADLDAAVNKAVSSIEPVDPGYTEEEVQAEVAAAVEAALSNVDPGYTQEEVQAEVTAAVQTALNNVDPGYTEEELQAHAEEAVSKALREVEPVQTGYTEEELQIQVAAAVAAKEAEILASLPADVNPRDPMDEITDEGDLSLRAQVKTYKEAVAKFEVYTKELEDYIVHLEGGNPEEIDTTPRTPDGRPLPKIRPEDL